MQKGRPFLNTMGRPRFILMNGEGLDNASAGVIK